MSDKSPTTTLSLLHFEGADASTTFTDSGTAPKTWTPSGNARIRTDVVQFGSAFGDSASGFFDGNGDYLTTADHADWTLGTTDFTIETWIYPTNWVGGSNFPCIIGKRSSNTSQHAFTFYCNSTGQQISFTGNNGGFSLSGDFVMPLNTWSHVAVSRHGTALRLFGNGEMVAENTSFSTSISDTTAAVRIAAFDSGPFSGSYFTGYMNEFRFKKGVGAGIYTRSFGKLAGPYDVAKRLGILGDFAVPNMNIHR